MSDSTEIEVIDEQELDTAPVLHQGAVKKEVQARLQRLNQIREKVQVASSLAASAQDRAQNGKVHMGLLGKRKAAIEELQGVVEDLATAQIQTTEAQELLFQYQTELTNISIFLANLCAGNAGACRAVSSELKTEIKALAHRNSDDVIIAMQKQTLQAVKKQADTQRRLEKRIERLEKQRKKGRTASIILMLVIIVLYGYFILLLAQENEFINTSIFNIFNLLGR